MTYRPIATAPDDRTITGKRGEIRMLVECADGGWWVKQSTAPDDWVFDENGEQILVEPTEWCEVP
ncbi:MAG: hypothetical protein JWL84_270 [Rhodospirillales bacterium]|jgi:hypothetical protein|nr:hypothetical protein [Rhodospirillales bacterium]